MALDREMIETVLMRNDAVGMHSVGRALIHLRNRQTADEIASETTNHTNSRGFTQAHSRVGVNMANFYESRGYLSPKQVAYWQSSPSGGRARIVRYSRQLLEEARAKQLRAYEAAEAERVQLEMDQYEREMAV